MAGALAFSKQGNNDYIWKQFLPRCIALGLALSFPHVHSFSVVLLLLQRWRATGTASEVRNLKAIPTSILKVPTQHKHLVPMVEVMEVMPLLLHVKWFHKVTMQTQDMVMAMADSKTLKVPRSPRRTKQVMVHRHTCQEMVEVMMLQSQAMVMALLHKVYQFIRSVSRELIHPTPLLCTSESLHADG